MLKLKLKNYFLFDLLFLILCKNKIIKYKKWGLGIGDWGLGIGDWGLGPIPNPQSPIPNPQFKQDIFIIIYLIKFNGE